MRKRVDQTKLASAKPSQRTVSSSDKSRVLGWWSLSIVHPTKPGSNTKSRMSDQSSGGVWKWRWPSWAPVPNKPKVSVDVKQNTSANNMSKSLQRTCQQKVISLRLLVKCILFWRLQHQCTHLQFDCSCNRIHFTNRRILIVIFNFSLLSFLLFLPLFFFFFFSVRERTIETESNRRRPLTGLTAGPNRLSVSDQHMELAESSETLCDWGSRPSCPRMSFDILGTSWDPCVSMVQ